jgi:hypothetical protein
MTGMNASALIVNPVEYFRSEVTRASSTLKVALGDDLEFYVVNLLVEFIDPSKISEAIGEQTVLDTPLVAMLQKASEVARPEQKAKIFKSLGDTSLYVAGFFQDFFNRKTFDISYYITMGSSAYDNVSTLMDRRGAIYSELSGNFSKLVDVMAEVASVSTKESNQNILAIYDRWTKYQSTRLRRILENAGIDPIPVNTKIAQ